MTRFYPTGIGLTEKAKRRVNSPSRAAAIKLLSGGKRPRSKSDKLFLYSIFRQETSEQRDRNDCLDRIARGKTACNTK